MDGLVQVLRLLAASARAHLHRESVRVGRFIDRRIVALLWIWAGLALVAGVAKLAMLIGKHPKLASFDRLGPTILAYLLAAIAPWAGYWLARQCFPQGALHRQPRVRLARIGRWVSLDPDEARRQPNFGMSGLIVSVVAGLLLCLVMRFVEYFLAVPAIPVGAPVWAGTFFWLMTFDLVFLSFLYSAAIAMALSAAPLFPRMLAYAWICDLMMQLAIARTMVNAGPLPAEIVDPLATFLIANTKKVLISAAIWLPYLLLSPRVNLTFRNRIRSPQAARLQFT